MTDATNATGYVPPSRWARMIGWNLLGVIIVLLAVGISLVNVLTLRKEALDPNRKVVRLMHWQLELGYRDALEQVIKDYNAIQAGRYQRGEIPQQIVVEQLPVTEKVFDQVLKVNLIAGTGPDIFTHRGNIELSRECASLNEAMDKPNPYNQPEFLGDEPLSADLKHALATLPWRDTAIDSMAGGFNRERQTQYSIPISFALGGRFAYNLDMLREITGSEELPRTTGELLTLGHRVQEFAAQHQRAVWPIAASRYNAEYFLAALPGVMLQPWFTTIDTNRDGEIDEAEGWAALASGKVSFEDRTFRQFLDASKAISGIFSTGFSAMDRDGGMYLFVQQKAPIIFCASWDAGTVIKLAKDRFRVAFGSIPIPGPGEPWNDPPRRGLSEAGVVSWGAYHINRNGKVAEAIDFMQYWTSRTVNQRFNRAADWIPSIIGTSPSQEMEAFSPVIPGYPRAWSPTDPGQRRGGQVTIASAGQMTAMTSGETTPDDFIARVSEVYRDPNYGASAIWAKMFHETRASDRNQDRVVSVLTAAAVIGDKPMPVTALRDLIWSQPNGLQGGKTLWTHRMTVGRPQPDGTPGTPFPAIDP